MLLFEFYLMKFKIKTYHEIYYFDFNFDQKSTLKDVECQKKSNKNVSKGTLGSTKKIHF